jgi:predicted RNA-binding Zn-ribbon protein involved in translation (DUF1610 family)
MSSVLPSPTPEPASAAASTAVPVVARPLGFNCPSCGVVLTIPNPSAYDGRPAPCPQCAVMVVPPRIFKPEQTEPEGIDLHPLPGLSAGVEGRIKMPRAVHRPRRRLDLEATWLGGHPAGVVMSGQP